jgi:hypothetical protein
MVEKPKVELSTLPRDISTLGFYSPILKPRMFNSKWFKSPGLKSSWFKSPELNIPGLKLGVEN